MHQRGLSCGPVQLTDIHVNERYWIQLKPRFQSCLAGIDFTSDSHGGHSSSQCEHLGPDDDYHSHPSSSKLAARQENVPLSSTGTPRTHLSNLHQEPPVVTTVTTPTSAPSSITDSLVYHVEHRYETYCRTQIDVVELIKQWQLGHVSNFDYLLILNALAGRRFHDPNNHLIFPWIHDFTSPTTNLRDLSQSKYRLNKGLSYRLVLLLSSVHLGDAQLDLTYNYYSTSVSTTTSIVPHHLSEHLSSITYYVYKARRTDKRILCEVGDIR